MSGRRDPAHAVGRWAPVATRGYELPAGRTVRRARDWRLYDDRGGRYLDFWQADGAAFLGHRPHGLAALVGAEIDRGVWTRVPTAWSGRLDRALARLARLAGFSALRPATSPWHADPQRWLPLSVEPGTPGVTRHEAADDAAGERSRAAGDREASVVLPFPAALALDPRGSAVFTAALARAADLLAAYLASDEARERVRLATGLRQPPGYRRAGVWFLPTRPLLAAASPDGNVSPTGAGHAGFDWTTWRMAALEQGIVLPPDAETPIAVPGIVGRVERAAWEEVCRGWPQ